jgi:hypothetical protein
MSRKMSCDRTGCGYIGDEDEFGDVFIAEEMRTYNLCKRRCYKEFKAEFRQWCEKSLR